MYRYITLARTHEMEILKKAWSRVRWPDITWDDGRAVPLWSVPGAARPGASAMDITASASAAGFALPYNYYHLPRYEQRLWDAAQRDWERARKAEVKAEKVRWRKEREEARRAAKEEKRARRRAERYVFLACGTT
jgi:hypothetical protein